MQHTGRGRILILEDEPLVLIELEDTLTDLGYIVAGAARTLAKGLELANALPLDAAVLDVNIAGSFSTPIADVLGERNVPVVFASGYTAERLPDRYKTFARINKPYDRRALDQALRRALLDGGAPF